MHICQNLSYINCQKMNTNACTETVFHYTDIRFFFMLVQIKYELFSFNILGKESYNFTMLFTWSNVLCRLCCPYVKLTGHYWEISGDGF